MWLFGKICVAWILFIHCNVLVIFLLSLYLLVSVISFFFSIYCDKMNDISKNIDIFIICFCLFSSPISFQRHTKRRAQFDFTTSTRFSVLFIENAYLYSIHCLKCWCPCLPRHARFAKCCV